MRHSGKCICVLVLLALALGELAHAEPVERITNCTMTSIQASFKAALSNYRVEANCETTQITEYGSGTTTNITIGWRWSSQGTYDPQQHVAREDVRVWDSASPSSAIATSTLSCPTDPWLGPSLGGGKVVCANPQFNSSGDVMGHYFYLAYLESGFRNSQLPNSTGFQYTRASLIMQRDAELKAEQEAIAAAAEAARQKQNKRLQQAVKPAPPVVAPAIVSPTANALFMQNAVVPIRLFPPQGMQVSGFMVKLERRDGNGNWVVVTTLPIGIGEATSPTGYTGWGAPGNGRDPSRMVSLPGSYRISAQVSSPRQTLWSAPVAFAVTSPQQSIQKAPKMFGR